MNYILKLCQPCYFYPNEITPNLRRVPLTLDEIETVGGEIEILQELKEEWYPFTSLIKITEEDFDSGRQKYRVKGYYLTGEFDLKRLKIAIEKRLMGKRLKHPTFSDNSVCNNMERVAISWNDTHILAEYGRGTKLFPRKKVK